MAGPHNPARFRLLVPVVYLKHTGSVPLLVDKPTRSYSKFKKGNVERMARDHEELKSQMETSKARI